MISVISNLLVPGLSRGNFILKYTIWQLPTGGGNAK